MNPSPIDVFIEQNKHLFWYTPEDKKAGISDELLLVNVINHFELSTKRSCLPFGACKNPSAFLKE
jgi:hypothetical protein